MPIWEGFDEPFHLAYVTFVAQHGRPPGYEEPSFPIQFYRLMPLLPSRFVPGAPSFEAWRRWTPQERATRRALAGQTDSGLPARQPYAHENYERQQPPLFYYAAAPVAWLLRDASLPQLVVGLRLFCVLLASLIVPFTAQLARLLLPQRGVLFALPIAALLPNTLFFVDRITNDALAWPILAATAGLLVLCARRPSTRTSLLLGLSVAAGVWTKMTLLPALPAALVAVLLAWRRRDGRRVRYLLAAVGVPALLIAPLLCWNEAASGSWSGITYASHGKHPGLLAVAREWGSIDFGFFFRYWIRNHLWSGGWEFLQPPAGLYGVIEAALVSAAVLAIVTAWLRGRSIPGRWRWLPLVSLGLFFLGAMFFHVLQAAAEARTLGKPPFAGAEGWYFDLLRPVEACAAAALLCAALPSGRTRGAVAALVFLLAAADAAGTLGLLLPHWAGLPSAGWSPAAIRAAVGGARQAAPLLYPLPLAALLAGVFLAACARLVVVANPVPTHAAGSLSRA